MSQFPKPEIGAITWTDLTVDNAEGIKNFYSKVVGWNFALVSMGDYNDFTMNTSESGKTIAGICHARGVNADLPSQWLIYITVANVETSAEQCLALGGKIIIAPKAMGGYGKFCVIQDPAGPVAALFDPAK
jgi:predicted enzyme related to lactoylglutathione lyase